MSVALLIARCLLAVVLVIAAVGKLADGRGVRVTLGEFGVPRALRGPGAVVLPVSELAIAVLLVPAATARAGAVASVVLLATFCVAIAVSLARGERPDCGCFGRARSTAAGPATLARNVGLAAVAATIAVVGPGEGVGEAVDGLRVSPVGVGVAVLVLALVGLAWFSWQLFRQHGRLIERVRALEKAVGERPAPMGLAIGAPAPAVGRRDWPADRSSVLLFSDPDCAPCAGLLPRLQGSRAALGRSVEIRLVTDAEALRAYRVPGVPSATLVDAHGRIASPTVTGEAPIETLIASAPATGPIPDALHVVAG